ncbi:hypothetical protein NKH18_24300 [Streptomyces sp. M10(2022)]
MSGVARLRPQRRSRHGQWLFAAVHRVAPQHPLGLVTGTEERASLTRPRRPRPL